ncbi:FKBP-type peptidyl-prolyl cis-trans isomerase [Pedobacter sandarakinus]|uniref:FKBP-type peptidyl-prolyl cis-trans isomerase n=1 Tax=Pedobacter sandarakinus TaxID=353156 RepID=UPI00224592EC|nr:FKBP-type peptidyl-prolyl cis-trans isomerase [Pedobacter sandarakinus]MCX2573249.1 FKBP-type peptidyl-prolyl cis-trans isomerase [Pedobacter sandarakinus]
MSKLKYILLLVCIAGCFAACKKDSTDFEEYDPVPQYKKDTAAIRAFVVANNIPAVKDPSGVFYQIITPGSGSVTYTGNTRITSDYEGKLLNGAIFDSTKGTPISFALGQVIVGWQIGIPKIQKGGKIRLIIPSYYGYGNAAQGAALPANSILDFTITLTDVQ